VRSEGTWSSYSLSAVSPVRGGFGTGTLKGMEPVKREPASGQAPGGKVKKPYQKPAFVYERAFETMALSCGKIGASQLQCKSNKKTS